MMHTGVFNGEVRHLLYISLSFPKKLFETHPHLLDFRNVIPLTNRQPELSRPVDYHVGDVNCLQLGVGRPGDVIEIEEFLDCGEHGCDRVPRVLICLLDDVLPFQKLVRHQQTVCFLEGA